MEDEDTSFTHLKEKIDELSTKMDVLSTQMEQIIAYLKKMDIKLKIQCEYCGALYDKYNNNEEVIECPCVKCEQCGKYSKTVKRCYFHEYSPTKVCDSCNKCTKELYEKYPELLPYSLCGNRCFPLFNTFNN